MRIQRPIDLDSGYSFLNRTKLTLLILHFSVATNTKQSGEGPHHLIVERDVKKTLQIDKGDTATLISWEIKDFVPKGGNMNTYVTSVLVTYSDDDGVRKEVSYVAKLNPCRGVNYDDLARLFFTNEILFFQTHLPLINNVLESAGQPLLRVPKFFHGCTENGKEVMYMEDLRPRGFKVADRRAWQFMDTTYSLILHEIARLHSASWVLFKRTSPEDLSDMLSQLRQVPIEGAMNAITSMMTKGVKGTIAILEHIGGNEKAVEWLKRHSLNWSKYLWIVGESNPPFDVLKHGDVHMNNVLFRYDDKGEPVEVMLVDFQGVAVASLSTELNYFWFHLANMARAPISSETFLEKYIESFQEVVSESREMLSFTFSDLQKAFQDRRIVVLVFAAGLYPHCFRSGAVSGDEFWEVNEGDAQQNELKRLLTCVDNSSSLKEQMKQDFNAFEREGLFDKDVEEYIKAWTPSNK
ncbi:hypothetical protein SK128_023582 [Halocaridina rubra]|uniref:CHK kinase-like domain-containing protein n=1 Tax=Halocaridina rubra TaxID=373956 RepID=A0AAN8WNE6_HALRR